MRLDPPLDPSSPEARTLLEEELRKALYQESEGLLERLWAWLERNLFGSDPTGGLPAWTIWVAAGLGLVWWRRCCSAPYGPSGGWAASRTRGCSRARSAAPRSTGRRRPRPSRRATRTPQSSRRTGR